MRPEPTIAVSGWQSTVKIRSSAPLYCKTKAGSLSHSCIYSVLVERPPPELKDGSLNPGTGRDFILHDEV